MFARRNPKSIENTKVEAIKYMQRTNNVCFLTMPWGSIMRQRISKDAIEFLLGWSSTAGLGPVFKRFVSQLNHCYRKQMEIASRMGITSFSAGIPSGTNPCWPCACCHSLWVHMCVSPSVFLSLFSLLSFIPSDLQNFCFLFLGVGWVCLQEKPWKVVFSHNAKKTVRHYLCIRGDDHNSTFLTWVSLMSQPLELWCIHFCCL